MDLAFLFSPAGSDCRVATSATSEVSSSYHASLDRAAFCWPFGALRLGSSGSLRMSTEVVGSPGTYSGLRCTIAASPYHCIHALDGPPTTLWRLPSGAPHLSVSFHPHLTPCHLLACTALCFFPLDFLSGDRRLPRLRRLRQKNGCMSALGKALEDGSAWQVWGNVHLDACAFHVADVGKGGHRRCRERGFA